MANHQMAAPSGARPAEFRAWLMNKLLMGMSWSEYSRALVTPFNIIAAAILTVSAPVFFMRYTQGLSSVVHASAEYPWGLLLSWGIFAGEPLFACGFVICAAYYIFGFQGYRPLVRLAVVGGMLGYAFAASYLLIDLGRPWRLYYPMMINFGPASILFIVAWHVSLYVNVQILEFSPAFLEWLGSKRVHRWSLSITMGLIVFGIILSTVHQSALGAMYLMTPAKLHPLWYSSYLPILFLGSVFYSALSFVIVMAWVAVTQFRSRCDQAFIKSVEPLTVGMAKGAAISLYVYFALKVLALAQDNRWALLVTPYGYWYLVEVLGGVLLPAMLFTMGARSSNIGLIRFAALVAMLGMLINRVNVNLIAYNWFMPDHFKHITPPWTETVMILAMVTLHLMVFRWLLNRMPILREDPAYKGTH